MTPNTSNDDPDETMTAADVANGEHRHDDAPSNDTEDRYGSDESPA